MTALLLVRCVPWLSVYTLHIPLLLFLIVKVLLSSSSLELSDSSASAPQVVIESVSYSDTCPPHPPFFFKVYKEIFLIQGQNLCLHRKFLLRVCLSVFVNFVWLNRSEDVDLLTPCT